jgi:hypothetical protein
MQTLDAEALGRACGGVNMKLTQYGYPSDMRADLYMPHGFVHRLPDRADVSLLR